MLGIVPYRIETGFWALLRESLHFVIIVQAFRLQVSASSCPFLWVLPKVSIIATKVNPEDLGVGWIEDNRQMRKGMEVPEC